MKKTKFALLQSVICLLLCMSMLIGTTFAWFTDSVTSGNNIIAAGNLDIELEYLDGDTWKKVNESTNVFKNDTLWEPGHTEVVYLKVSNAGTLALKYQLGVNIASEVGSVNQAGDDFLLSDYIYFGAVEGVSQAYADRAAARAAVTAAEKISTGYAKTGTMEKGAEPQYVAMVVYMPEETGNAANYATGENPPSITLGIELLATQMTSESDSYDKTYDENAAADFFPGFQGGTAGAAVTTDAQGATTAEVTVEGGDVSAVIPANVLVADGVSTLTLTVTQKDTSNANVQLNADEEMRPLDVHIEGVAAGNTVPMLITLEHYLTTGINTGALRLYHVENGATVAMTQVANPVNHNEFSYDPATGNVTLALASFSEVAVVADTRNPWNGETETAYTGSGTEADPYLINNADQLAYFRTQVDNGNSFAGKFVKLNNNIYLSGKLFDPIGWGYVNSGWNRDGVDGKVFQGTFDGNGKVILDLYQNGWDMEDPDEDGDQDADYTYTNCGFGLFAAASNATFKNLTISGAYVRTECVEMGVLVGLSQNSCTYDNIKIVNSKIANYQRPAGGLIGEVSGDGTTTIKNVIIGSDVVVGSLWGDFDAPVGGVIGARWDDAGKNPQIVMTNVDVGARLDVYNDITSAYQWHAYRRAGMLIGNTELTASDNKHLAAAPFLTCTKDADGNDTVRVYYGDWVNYHYCEFTNQDNTWARNYPWVRVEAGENCSAYSNPRYGQPVVGGVTVSTDDHTCTNEHHMLRQFSQLYGGGQGVYGQDKHEGVTYPDNAYSITYVNDGKTLDVIYVTNNTEPYPVGSDQAEKLVHEWATENMKDYNGCAFGGWMTAAAVKLDKIPAGNKQNIVLYPYFTSPHTASFVDQNSNVLAWCFFNEINIDNLPATFAAANENLPEMDDDFELNCWIIRGTDEDDNKIRIEMDPKNPNWESFKGYNDVTITPKYRYKGVDLIEVYDELTGEIDHYEAAGYGNGVVSAVVKIPGSVNGKEVTQINKNAFSSYNGVHSILIPAGVTYIGDNAFAEKWGTADSGETITIYYAGSYTDWVDKEKDFGSKWESGISGSSRIFFLNGGNTVDVSEGYLQAKVNGYTASSKTVSWSKETITSGIIDEYTDHCDCSISTEGDTGHIYVDANGNVMKHNAEGTPVNANGTIIEYKRKNIFSSYKLTTNHNDTYYRYRPDKQYWDGVTVN